MKPEENESSSQTSLVLYSISNDTFTLILFLFQVCGTFQAVPVSVDETSCEEDNQAGNKVDVGRFRQRKTFLESMLKAESVIKESFARIDQVQNHKLKELKDLDETKKGTNLF